VATTMATGPMVQTTSGKQDCTWVMNTDVRRDRGALMGAGPGPGPGPGPGSD
jgi:hypothetical protein